MPADKPAISAWFTCLYYVFATCIALTVINIGLVPQELFPLDSFVLITGAWKVANGFIPYVDFSTLYGPANYFVLAATMLLTRNSPLALPLSVVVTLLPVSILVWRIASSRYPGWIAFWLASYLTLIWASSVPLHFFFFETSYANFENREGYVFVSLILMILVPTSKNPKPSSVSLVTVGVILGMLLFIKINYFYSGCLLVVLLMRLSLVKRFLWLLLGLLIGAAPFICLLSFKGVLIMFEELRNVVGVRSDSLYRDALLLVIIEMPIAFVFIWDLYQKTVIQNGRKLANELELMAVFVVAASLEFGSFASIHMFECPLIACYAVILASRIPKLMWNHAGVIAGLIILNGLSYENTLLGIWSPIAFRSFCADSEHQVLSTIYPIKTITFWEQDKKSEKTPIEWANYINDGIALINKHNIPNNVPIGSLNVADFFSYPMGHLPPSHTYVWLSIGVTIGTSNYPAPEYLLSSCGYVMIPTNPTPSVDFLGKIPAYRSFINSHYHKLDSSTYWELWQMN